MMKEVEIQVGPQDIEGTAKEVWKVCRNLAQKEKGKKSSREDAYACPEEMSNVDLHTAME